MRLIVVIALSVLVLTILLAARGEDVKKSVAGKKKKLDPDEIEKAWEQGDDAEELEKEHERLKRMQEKHMPKFDINDKESLKRAYKQNPSTFGNGQGNIGSAMIFIDVRKKSLPLGEARTKKELDTLSNRWTSMLQNAGYLTNIYNTDGMI